MSTNHSTREIIHLRVSLTIRWAIYVVRMCANNFPTASPYPTLLRPFERGVALAILRVCVLQNIINSDHFQATLQPQSSRKGFDWWAEIESELHRR